MHKEELRFSELKPKELESNIFMYHLKSLIKQGYVVKNDNGYSLAPAGLHYADNLSHINLKPRSQPKIITILVVQNSYNQLLLAQRKVQPFINLYMFPSGKQHLYETINEHVKRESIEKLSIKLDFAYKGEAEIVMSAKGIIISHVIAHVHYVRENIALPKENDRFIYSWANLQNIKEDSIMPGTSEIFQELENHKTFILKSMKFEI